ncbi:MAG: ArnT family glycosyltransferase, partial [Nanoarchaeota archaeon]
MRWGSLIYLVARNLSVVFLLFLIMSIFGFSFVDMDYFFYIIVVVDSLALLFNENKRVKEYVKYLFLGLLVLVAVSSIGFFEDVFLIGYVYSLLNDYLTHLTVLTIAAGVMTFYFNKDVIDKVEKEKDEEEKKEKKREKEFDKKFKRLKWFDFDYRIKKHLKEKDYLVAIARVLISPIVFFLRMPYTFTKWCYREGWWVVIGLVLILLLFTAIKAPHMDLTFTGKHEMKYSAIVEPAKHMYEMNDPLWNQKKYRTVPIINPDGKHESFGHYPLMEWGLYATFKLFPENSYEFNARMFTAFFGLIFLLGMFHLLKKFMSKKATLLVLLLLSTNVIIQFFSYVTVMDTTMLIFFIFSLIALINGLKKDWLPLIFLAGVLGGIGVNLKYSLIIISLCIYILFIFCWPRRGLSQKLNYALYFFPFLVSETVFF